MTQTISCFRQACVSERGRHSYRIRLWNPAKLVRTVTFPARLKLVSELVIDLDERECSGIKRTTPAEPVFVLLVLGIGERVQVILEPDRSANILRRTTTLTVMQQG